MCWVECSFTHLKARNWKLFHFLIIFFHYFCPFFRKNTLWPIYPHLMPPHGPPHISCGLILYPHIPWAQPTYQWHCNQKNFRFLKFFEKLSFWPSLAILPSGNPLSKCLTKKIGALGSLLRVPSPSPDLTPSPKSRQHELFSPGGIFGTHHPSRPYDTGCGKNGFGVVIFAELSFFFGTR